MDWFVEGVGSPLWVCCESAVILFSLNHFQMPSLHLLVGNKNFAESGFCILNTEARGLLPLRRDGHYIRKFH